MVPTPNHFIFNKTEIQQPYFNPKNDPKSNSIPPADKLPCGSILFQNRQKPFCHTHRTSPHPFDTFLFVGLDEKIDWLSTLSSIILG